MDDAMADGRERTAAECPCEPPVDRFECGRQIRAFVCLQRAFGWAFSRLRNREARADADPVQLPFQEPLQLRPVLGPEQLELDAGAAGIQDEEQIGQRIGRSAIEPAHDRLDLVGRHQGRRMPRARDGDERGLRAPALHLRSGLLGQ
jgi:hypothetical protein